MKTLDEVIKAWSICFSDNSRSDCTGCPYADEDGDAACFNHDRADALHYLKEYQRIGQALRDSMDGIQAWNKAMSAEKIEWLAEYATGLQTEPERTAKVRYEIGSKRVYIVNEGIPCSMAICGNCEGIVMDGWKYCPSCGARLEWK